MSGSSSPLDAPSATSGQRRYVTVLFSDVSGSSEHAEQLEAEAYALLLERFRHFARNVIPRHGGSIARLQGDGVLALFGHLQNQEDDGRRAVEAALELHAAVNELRAGSGAAATVLQLHSGIHAGLVLLIEGDIERGRFDVVGEVPNTASRLCSLARAGQILVSEETLGPQAHFFQASLLRRTAIRGRSAPLNVLRIDGRASVQRRIDAAARRGVVPFVGRGPVLARLAQAADRAHARETSVMALSGEPGIGKTRLIDEFQRRLDPAQFTVLQGCCESYLGAEPLQPFMQALRVALGWRSGASPADNEAALAAVLAPLGEDDAAARALLGGRNAAQPPSAAARMATIVHLIGLLARQRTLVLALDDWQWADDASRQVLDSLCAQELPLLVLLALRSGGSAGTDEDLLPRGLQPLRLQALDAGEADGAIAAWLPDLDPFVVQEIYRRSGGSPLFIEELCHAAAAGSDLLAAPRGGGLAWINTLVASRLARLPGAEAEGLRLAAVAGNTFPAWLLERLIGADAAPALLQTLAQQDFLVPAGADGMLRFKHGLTREAVYDTVEPGRRRALHLRVAQSLEAAVGSSDEQAFDWLESLSYHYDAAGINDKAAHYAEAAGDKALAAMALDRARAHYITALRALDALPELPRPAKLRWCHIAQRLGQTCVFDPLDVSHGLQLFERAAQLAHATGDANTLARAEYWLAYVNYGKGQPRAAVQHGEAALLHALASEDQRLAAQVRATLGQSLASAGRYDRALPLMNQAVESRRAQLRPGALNSIGTAYTLGRTAYTLGDLGRFDDAHACFAEALHWLGDQVHSVAASVRELMCAVHLWQGRWNDAHEAGLAGADIALRCRSRYLTAMGRALGACGGWAATQDPAALQSLRESTQWIDMRGGAVSTSLNHGWLVEACVSLGLTAEARQHAARLLLRARAQDRHGEAMGRRALARLAAQQGDRTGAARHLHAADAAAQWRGSARELAVNLLARAELDAAAGQLAQAQDRAAQAADSFATMQMAWHLARAQRLLSKPPA